MRLREGSRFDFGNLMSVLVIDEANNVCLGPCNE
jgi:hypothetical protein